MRSKDRTDCSIPSPVEIEAVQNGRPGKGFTAAQLRAWGVPWPPPAGWRKRLGEEWRLQQSGGPGSYDEAAIGSASVVAQKMRRLVDDPDAMARMTDWDAGIIGAICDRLLGRCGV